MQMRSVIEHRKLPPYVIGFAGAGVVLCMLLVEGCASRPEPVSQTIEVRIASDVREWRGLIACQASNARGHWDFIAPGEVTVLMSTTALRIVCQAPVGAVAETKSPVSYVSRQQQGQSSAQTGAWVGAGAGTALAVASAPFLGAGGLLFIVGGAGKGYEYGSFIGLLQPDQIQGYPSPITVQLLPAAKKN